MNTKVHTGSCLCKNIKFEVHGEFEYFFLCHCSRCRHVSGSAHGANLFSKNASLKILKGKENIKDYQVPGSRFTTSFCINCGGKLPKDLNGKILQVPAGSLESKLDKIPNAHIFCASRANWDQDLEQTEHYDENWKKD